MMSEEAILEKDLAAIERLHQKDMAASKAGDFVTLRSIMTDDAVVMPDKGKWIRGKTELDAGFRNMEKSMSQMDVLEYIEEFEEVRVLGEYAFEWGTIRGSMRPKAGGEIEYSSYKVMRILEKQSDGEWKVHRTIWNENPPASTKQEQT
jgi:uncharacterized protein (TIGR02246 family)